MAATSTAHSPQNLLLDGIRDTGIKVGEGAYAMVFQYEFHGLKCAGKKLQSSRVSSRREKFEKECQLLGRLRHPNIVQFLGIYVDPVSDLPVLVMEYLPMDLSRYLDRHGVPPAEISYSILRDVALGLRYLHEYKYSAEDRPIVHRDLSANNVLLSTSLSAKISDLGVAKILNITPSHKKSTKAPGTPCYMPPEALRTEPVYTPKYDSYSFGVMVLHVLCGEWPFPTDLFQHDPHNTGKYILLTEVDRRAKFLQKIGSDHPLSGLVRQCLSNSPVKRPESADILQQINTALSQVPAPAETVFQQLEGLRSENQRLVTEIKRLENRTYTGVRLQWRKCADCPIEMSRAQAVVVGEKVYVGGGHTKNDGDRNQLLLYNWRGDEWSTLPRCPVRWFGMAYFMGRIVTVGGEDDQNRLTGKVYALREETHQWEEFITPLPTARYALSVVTTSTAIIAAGGLRMNSTRPYSSKVEVYSSDTSEWHIADPLPTRRAWMSSVTIDDTCYLLGGTDYMKGAIKNCWCVSLSSLIERAVSSSCPSSHSKSVWNQLQLQATPLRLSGAVCLDSSLMVVGGITDEHTRSSAVYVFRSNSRSWVSLRSSDLLPCLSLPATAQLSPAEVIVIGGSIEPDEQSRLKTVLIGTLHSL